MYPVDLLKTRMQILHPTSGALYTGLTNAVSTIYRIEGWRTLWKGVSSVIVGAGKELIMDICAWVEIMRLMYSIYCNRSGPRGVLWNI